MRVRLKHIFVVEVVGLGWHVREVVGVRRGWDFCHGWLEKAGRGMCET